MVRLQSGSVTMGLYGAKAGQFPVKPPHDCVAAAWAGDAGRGFAIIAIAVKGLADQIQGFSGQINTLLTSMSSALAQLETRAQANADAAHAAMSESAAAAGAAQTLNQLVGSVGALVGDIERMRAPVLGNSEGFAAVEAGLDALARSIEESEGHLGQAEKRASSILSISEDFILFIAESGVETSDTPFIKLAKERAGMVSALFEEALSRGEIGLADLFDENYVPVKGTDPQQVLTRFTGFTDRHLPAIQEPVLAFDKRITFCAAVDRNGYLPTHNRIYSHPQGDDSLWNAAHCRNRRIFDDRTGLAAGRSTKPFLLQTYRRDMGGGEFVLMKDCSAPISVNGRHWGGMRIAFKVG